MSPIEQLPPELFHLILGFLEFETRLIDQMAEAEPDVLFALMPYLPKKAEVVSGDHTLIIEHGTLHYRYPRRNEQRVDHFALRLCSRSVYSLTPRLPQLKSPKEWVSLHQKSHGFVGVCEDDRSCL